LPATDARGRAATDRIPHRLRWHLAERIANVAAVARRKYRSILLGGRTAAEHGYDVRRAAQKRNTQATKGREQKQREYDRKLREFERSSKRRNSLSRGTCMVFLTAFSLPVLLCLGSLKVGRRVRTPAPDSEHR
jgi:hypothetical protein